MPDDVKRDGKPVSEEERRKAGEIAHGAGAGVSPDKGMREKLASGKGSGGAGIVGRVAHEMDAEGRHGEGLSEEQEMSLTTKAKSLFDAAYEAHREQNLGAMTTDRDFMLGDQWEQAAKIARGSRPALTLNQLSRIKRSIDGRVTPTMRRNRVRVTHKGADKQILKVVNGIMSEIERRPETLSVYKSGLSEMLMMGMGAWRVYASVPEDGWPNEEILSLKPIDATCVLFDPSSRLPTRSDADYCFVFEDFKKEAFIARFGDDVGEWEKPDPGQEGSSGAGRYWGDRSDRSGEDRVKRVVEFWFKEPEEKSLARNSEGRIYDLTGMSDEEIRAVEVQWARGGFSERVKKMGWGIRCALMTADKVLDYKRWPGQYFPIIPAFGDVMWDGSVEVHHSLIRFTRDAQRIVNYSASSQAENMLRGSATSIVVTDSTLARHPDWEAPQNKLVQTVPDDTGQPDGPMKPEWFQPPPESPGVLTSLNLGLSQIFETAGITPALLGQPSNIRTGNALKEQDDRAGESHQGWVSGMSIAIQHTGMVILNLMPHIYSTHRRVSIVDSPDGVLENMEINVPNPSGGGLRTLDMTAARHDYDVWPGVPFEAQNEQTIALLLELAGIDKGLLRIFADQILKEKDIPGTENIIERLRRNIPPPLVGEHELTEKERESIIVGKQAEAAANQKEMEMKEGVEQARIGMMEKRGQRDEAEARARIVKAAQDMAGFASRIDGIEENQKEILQLLQSGRGTGGQG